MVNGAFLAMVDAIQKLDAMTTVEGWFTDSKDTSKLTDSFKMVSSLFQPNGEFKKMLDALAFVMKSVAFVGTPAPKPLVTVT